MSDPQELLVIHFQDPEEVKDALKNTKIFSRKFKVQQGKFDQRVFNFKSSMCVADLQECVTNKYVPPKKKQKAERIQIV